MATETEMDSEGHDPMDRGIGATWFELGLSFSAFFGVTGVLGHKSHSSGIRPRP